MIEGNKWTTVLSTMVVVNSGMLGSAFYYDYELMGEIALVTIVFCTGLWMKIVTK